MDVEQIGKNQYILTLNSEELAEIDILCEHVKQNRPSIIYGLIKGALGSLMKDLENVIFEIEDDQTEKRERHE